MAPASVAKAHSRIDDLTEKVGAVDRLAHVNEQKVDGHIDECLRMHKENREDRAEKTKEINRRFDKAEHDNAASFHRLEGMVADLVVSVRQISKAAPSQGFDPAKVAKVALVVIVVLVGVVAGMLELIPEG